MSDANDTASDTPEPKLREVRYRHSLSFVDVFRELGATLLVIHETRATRTKTAIGKRWGTSRRILAPSQLKRQLESCDGSVRRGITPPVCHSKSGAPFKVVSDVLNLT